MKVGDLVKKRWGRIDPEDCGAIGIIIKKPSTYGGNPDFVTVMMPYGARFWRMSDMEKVNEGR
jgi:hypothetical protein